MTTKKNTPAKAGRRRSKSRPRRSSRANARKKTPGQLKRDDARASGLSVADEKKLLRELAPIAELRKVMNISGFMPTTPAAYQIVHFEINGKRKKHTRYKLLDHYEGRNGKPDTCRSQDALRIRLLPKSQRDFGRCRDRRIGRTWTTERRRCDRQSSGDREIPRSGGQGRVDAEFEAREGGGQAAQE